jgi:hypothetical protein
LGQADVVKRVLPALAVLGLYAVNKYRPEYRGSNMRYMVVVSTTFTPLLLKAALLFSSRKNCGHELLEQQ